MDLLQLHKSLADTTRLRIVLLLVDQGELCVCDLTQTLQLSQPKISRHLALLRQADLLQDRRQGQWIYYQIHPQLPDWANRILQAGLEAYPETLQQDRAACTPKHACC